MRRPTPRRSHSCRRAAKCSHIPPIRSMFPSSSGSTTCGALAKRPRSPARADRHRVRRPTSCGTRRPTTSSVSTLLGAVVVVDNPLSFTLDGLARGRAARHGADHRRLRRRLHAHDGPARASGRSTRPSSSRSSSPVPGVGPFPRGALDSTSARSPDLDVEWSWSPTRRDAPSSSDSAATRSRAAAASGRHRRQPAVFATHQRTALPSCAGSGFDPRTPEVAPTGDHFSLITRGLNCC